MNKEKIPGIILIILALLLNPWILGYAVTEDNKINVVSIIIVIIFFEVLLLVFGVYTFQNQESFSKRRKEYFLLIISIVSTLILIECTLRIYPQVAGQQFTNAVHGKYNTNADGIYYYDSNTNISFMKPLFVATNYYNGYYWEHKTDSKGFRNEEESAHADIILLGDSFIYGHGVNINETVGFFLENMTGNSVVNLGRQGDTTYQELYVLKQFGLSYQPKYVLYFFYENDVIDLYVHNVNIDEFLANPYENSTWLNSPHKEWIEEKPSSLSLIFQKPYLMRAVSMVIQGRSVAQLKAKITNDSKGWNYTEHAIILMNNMSQERSMKLIIIPITPSSNEMRTKIEEIATRNNISVIDTREITDENPSFFLEHDGHFSPEGAMAMAKIIDEYLEDVESEKVQDMQ